tara:strand:- start:516 stop:3248 length:2733 start_codon:yes stop_codon:yes gene_type:complete
LSDENTIRKLFLEAQQLDPTERQAFIDRATEGNAALRSELLSLLSASNEADSFFDRFAGRIGREAMLDKLASKQARPWPDSAPGDTIGAYTLLREFGRGGMGTVWLAERNDGRFEGHVAIKLLAVGGIAVQRFKLEGHFLGRLSHPNVARLLDAGVTDAGQPYLVLEYADGVAIDEYCNERILSVDSRIRLFLNVADAVAHAHAHLIVHRDLKPSNVIVDGDGQAKLLDFGVARLLSADPGGNDTREIDTALTPAFAAPEQLLGGTVTTATDVYSLGLLLYVLLAGRNPREGIGAGSVSELHALANDAPPKLSDYVTQTTSDSSADNTITHINASPQALRRRLRGDLDNILQRAMAPDAADRYQTVAAFADDLQRYLRHEPVSAQPPTVTYRVSKFVRRHRGGVLVAAMMLTAVVASAMVATWQMIEARQQRDFALLQQQRLLATNEFLSQLLSDVGANGEPMSLIELLDRGVELIDTQYDTEDKIVASTLFDISVFYSALGVDNKRRELIERALDVANRSGDDALAAHIMCSRSRLDAYSNPEQALSDLSQARERLLRSSGDHLSVTINCHRAAGLLRAAEGKHDEAIEEFSAAIAATDNSPLNLTATRANLMNDLAEQYFHLNRTREAVALLEESIAMAEQGGRGNRVATIIGRFNRAAVITRMGEVASAAAEQRVGLERLDRIGRPLLGARTHYAGSLLFLDRHDEALPLFEAELDSAREAGNTRWVASAELAIGTIYAKQGELEKAEPYLARAEAEYQAAERGQQRNLSRVQLSRAQGLMAIGDSENALRLVSELLDEVGFPESDKSPELMTIVLIAAKASLQTGAYDQAVEFATKSYELAAAAARDESRSAHVGLALLVLGKAHLANNNAAEARKCIERAATALDFGMGTEHHATLEARDLLRSL